MNRRQLLGTLVAATAVAGLETPLAWASRPRASFAGRSFPGLQLYTVGAALEEDFDGTLRQVAAIGYRDVELPAFYGKSAQALRQSLSRAGLSCLSAHVPQVPWASGSLSLATDLDGVLRYADALRLRHIVCPMPVLLRPGQAMPAFTSPAQFAQALFGGATREDWLRFADFLNRTGERVTAAGFRFAYHNHNVDFRAFQGVRAYDLLLQHTEPALVDFEMDVGWICAGGGDPLEYLRRHPGRYRLMHIKDVKPDQRANTSLEIRGTEAGKGRVDWPAVLEAAMAGGLEQGYVELDPPGDLPPLDSIRESYRYLSALAL